MVIPDKNNLLNCHTAKALKDITGKWWGTDIWFYDNQNGFDVFCEKIKNPVCSLLNKKTTGKRMCNCELKKNIKSLLRSRKEISFKCFTGLYGQAVPLLDNKECVGALISCGMWQPLQNGDLKSYVQKFANKGFCKKEIEISYKKLKPANKHSLEYLYSLMKLVVNDLMTFRDMIKFKEGIIKRQTALIEKAYKSKYKAIISASSHMKEVFDTLELIENCEVPVLIDGETGTGKELLAAAIHYNSPRRDKMFIAQNCAVFTDTILSSELFGHKKGAFTGAVSDKTGLFEIADKSTLFLDEIGDMTMEVQAKLLRVIETGTFYGLGDSKQKKVNVRIIVATNKDLQKQVKKGIFREDFLFRINTIHITLPPLRDRGDDIILLANYFIETCSATHNKEVKEMSPELIDILMNYSWPGNIREMKSTIERLIIVSGNDDIFKPLHLPKNILNSIPVSANHAGSTQTRTSFKNAVESFEKSHLEKELKKANWDKNQACNILKISRTTLNKKIKQYNIKRV